jgi:hypothetical protein
MHDESTPDDALALPDRAEAVVLLLLLTGTARIPWSLREVQLELGEDADAQETVASLHAAGLVHRFGEFVFPTRAAVRLVALQGTSI